MRPQTRLELAAGVDAALHALAMATAHAEAVAEAARHQEKVTRTERLTPRTGAGTQTGYLRAEADLLPIRSALAEAPNSNIAASVELARITGELTSARPDENLESLR